MLKTVIANSLRSLLLFSSPPPLIQFSISVFVTLTALIAYPEYGFPLSYPLLLFLSLATVLSIGLKQHLLSGVLIAMVCLNLHVKPLTEIESDNCHATFIVIPKNQRQVILHTSNLVCEGLEHGTQNLNYWLNSNSKQLVPYQRYQGDLSIKTKRHYTNPDSFDGERYDFTNKSNYTVNKLHTLSPSPQNFRDSVRHNLRIKINTHLPDYADIAKALLLGERAQLSNTVKHTLQQTGTGHILAISGLHVGILALWTLLLGQTFWAMSSWLSARVAPVQFGCFCAFICISAYAWLTGFSLPTQRAWIMLSIFLASRAMFYEISTQTIWIALITVLLINPLAVINIGFYLSFIATYIVITIYQTKWHSLTKIISIQIAITFTLLPITWYTFGQASIAGLFANLLLLPWISIILMPMLFLNALLSIALDYHALWFITQYSFEALFTVLSLFTTQLSAWNINQLMPILSIPPSLTLTVISTLTMLWLCPRKLYLLPIILLTSLFFLTQKTLPTIIIGDSRYLSALVHDGEHAIIINPGYRNQQYDEAKKWMTYLARHQLILDIVVLTDTNLKRAAATTTLIRRNSNTDILLTQKKPFIHHPLFCTNRKISDNLAISMSQANGQCIATINWFNKSIALNHDKADIHFDKRDVVIDQHRYDLNDTGQIRYFQNREITFAKNKQYLWRIKNRLN